MSLVDRLRRISAARLLGMRRGIEKESLRAQPSGALALTPHPSGLGAPLTHPRITTDFSESQLELITGVHGGVEGCLDELTRTHQFVYRTLALDAHRDERLWVGSMPCCLPTDETIPLALYGNSNIGRAKSVYRMGLGHRYGRRMQTISGIHYNWSLPGLSNDEHFALIRNFRRHAFVLLWLFGASPAVCASFVAGRAHGLQPLGDGSLHLPHATSLRMGRLGYQSEAQASLAVSCNSLESYAASLHEALTTPYPPYEKIGIRNLGGEYNQLSDHAAADRERVLRHDPPQARDRERRAPAARAAPARRRVRRGALHGPRPLRAGGHRGADDALPRHLPAALPAGRQPARHAGRDRRARPQPGPHRDPRPRTRPDARARRRQGAADRLGRRDRRRLRGHRRRARRRAWRHGLRPGAGGGARRAGRAAGAAFGARAGRDRSATSAARYIDFIRAQSEQTRSHLLALPWTAAQQAEFEAEARASVARRRAIEAADDVDFETFRQAYLAAEGLAVAA